jgi:Toprim domain-containing protein
MSSEIHVISENDLQGVKKIGRRIRALCPVHNSRDRDLSIAPYYPELEDDDEANQLAGWGHCHSAKCGVTVLVKEWNPRAARKCGTSVEGNARPKITVSLEEAEQADERQRKELDALQERYPAFQKALMRSRPLAYLAGRGLSGELVDFAATLGIAYIPPADKWGSKPLALLSKWCDRLIFPFTTREGERGYLGRTLHLWQPGMDENEHKRVIEVYNDEMEEKHHGEAYKYQVRRWEKTYRSGFFHAEALDGEHITIVEGPFDAIPLLAAGINDIAAIAGAYIDIKAIPLNVCAITLAFDADTTGKAATLKVVNELARKGITPRICMPPQDGRGKDWSERYRLHGREGLVPLLAATPDVCLLCGAPSWTITDDNKAYCKVCWRAMGNEPVPGEECCQCGDLSDCLDEDLFERTGEMRAYCTDCWQKVGMQTVNVG